MTRRSKRRATAAPSKTKAASAETDLIRECVIYAQSIAARREGYRADPDGNGCHAAALGDQYIKRANQALKKISALPATTPKGLFSKARIVPILFEHFDGAELESECYDLLKLFAADVKRFWNPSATACDAAAFR